jgi:CRP-like cAMP-binding protein
MSATRLRSLADAGWLAEQPAAFRDRLAAIGRWTRLRRGQSVYTAGDKPDAIFGLDAGNLDVSLPISHDEEVVIHRAGPGFWVGDSGLLAQADRTITITAATDCDVFRVPGAAIRAQLDAHPEDWVALFNLNHRNATLAVRTLAEVLALPPRARFARMLLRLAGPDGGVTATQEDLGRLAGMSRATFRRAFAELIASGAVQTGYGALRIVDRARLETEADAR